MSNPNQCAQLLTEKELLQDSLIGQKHITASYNTFAGECVCPQLRGTMLNILEEEHNIQAELFSCLQANGWYQPAPAEQQKIQQARQKFAAN